LHRLFDSGFSTWDSGMGLGLALVKKMVTDHNGHIEVESEAGQGTILSIYQTMAEDHARKSVGECHPYREFEGMRPSRQMKTSLASATGVSKDEKGSLKRVNAFYLS